MNNNQQFYKDNAATLIRQYDSVAFDSVHGDWMHLLPTSGHVLDIGSGSGRDAKYMASIGLSVVAVEPESELLSLSMANTHDADIQWVQDGLPALKTLDSETNKFDLILMSALWMHLSPLERQVSMKRMVMLLSANGKLVISLRFGGFVDMRTAYDVSVKEVISLAHENDIFEVLRTGNTGDKLGRDDVYWRTIAFQKHSHGNHYL